MTDASRNYHGIPIVAFNSLLERVALIEATLRGHGITNNVIENHLLRSLADRIDALESSQELPTPDLASWEKEIQSRIRKAVEAEREACANVVAKHGWAFLEPEQTIRRQIENQIRARGTDVKP